MEDFARAASPAPVPPPPGESDGELVRRVRGGEREAFRALVVRHQDALYRHARRMTGSSDVAADLVQAAFVKAYTRLDSCDPDRFAAWLFRILTNRSKDHLKSPRRREVSLEAVRAGGPAAAEDPERLLMRSELRTTLQSALNRLPDAQREAFLLKHVEGLGYDEIAERVGASTSALKMRVHRARDALKAMLEEEP